MEQLLSFAGVSVDRKLLARIIAKHSPTLMNITTTATATKTPIIPPFTTINNGNKDNQEATIQSLSMEVTTPTPCHESHSLS